MFDESKATFAIADYVFKFLSWNVFIGLVAAYGEKLHRHDLQLLSGVLIVFVSAVAANFVSAFIKIGTGRFDDRAKSFMVHMTIFIFLVPVIALVDVYILDMAKVIASKSSR